MIKKLLAICVLCLLFLGCFGLYSAYQYRQDLREQRQNAKQPQTSITLVEGWTNRQIASYLTKQEVVSQDDDFLSALKTFDAAGYDSSLPKEAQGNLEGFIFPDTYFIPSAAPAGENISQIIIQKAFDNFSPKNYSANAKPGGRKRLKPLPDNYFGFNNRKGVGAGRG